MFCVSNQTPPPANQDFIVKIKRPGIFPNATTHTFVVEDEDFIGTKSNSGSVVGGMIIGAYVDEIFPTTRMAIETIDREVSIPVTQRFEKSSIAIKPKIA